MIIKSILS